MYLYLKPLKKVEGIRIRANNNQIQEAQKFRPYEAYPEHSAAVSQIWCGSGYCFPPDGNPDLAPKSDWCESGTTGLQMRQRMIFYFDADVDPVPASDFDADPDVAFHSDTDPDPAS